MIESEVKECPKCGGEMIRGSTETLGHNFVCTRREPKPEELQVARVQSYHCRKCGYIEFYRQMTKKKGSQ